MLQQKRHHRQTLPEDRIPLGEKIGLCLGYIAATGTGNTGYGMVNFIFNITLGMNPALLSTVRFIQSIIGFITSPILGQFSDNFRSRWGRRIPLMAVAAAPMVLMMVVLYSFPAGLSEHGMVLWLLITLPLLSLALGLYNPPLSGLGIEATTDYHERIRFGTLIMLVVFGFSIVNEWIFPLIQQPVFGNPMHGLHIIIGALAVFFGLAAFAPVFLCPEKRYIAHTKHLAKTRLLPNLMEARKNRPFLIVLSIKFFTFFCYSTVGLLGVYMNTYFVYGGDVKRAAGTYAVLGSSYAIAACTSFFIYPHIARLLGKKRALQCAAGLLVFGCICKLFVYQPKHPWLQLIVLMANGASVQGINFVIGTMMGDVIDYDELLSGKRREALYSSLVSWFESAGQSFGLLICGFLLVWIGFDAKIGAQHPHTLHLMRFFYFLCPFIGGLFAVFMISRYDLTEDRAYEIKDELNRRHASLSGSGEQTEQTDEAVNQPNSADLLFENMDIVTKPDER